MKKDFLFSEINKLKGVGTQLSKYLKKKRIEVINLTVEEMFKQGNLII